MAPGAPGLQLCIFDSTRGQQEGHELDKILFYHPLDVPLPSQLSAIGLSEGLIIFSRIFSPSAPCEFMEAEKHFHIFYECEPDIWIVLIVEKNSDGELLTRDNAYRNVLKQMYSIFCLFYGSLTTLLRANPMADVVRNCLYCFVPDFIRDMLIGKNLRLPTVSDSLAETGTVQVLPLGSEVLIEAQSLVGLLESRLGGGGNVRHSLILFHKYLVTTTLSPDETAAIFSYAMLRLVPAAITRSYAQGPKRSHSRSSMINSVVSTFVSDAKRNSFVDVGDTCVSDGLNSRVNACRPMKQDAWWQDSDGFLATDAWAADSQAGAIPVVYVQGPTRMQFCVYQHRALTLVVLVPVPSGYEPMALLRKHVLEKAAHKIQMLEEKLSREWGGNNSLHVPGYRYLQQDINRKLVKASPPGKVATLAKDSLIALDRVRQQVDTERDSEGESELCLRTKNNAWVCTRTRAGHELYVVLEKASDTLLLASEAIEKFNKRHCDGKFASD